MAHIMRPRPGEDCHDYACGSAGLLVKLQLVARELDPTSNVPLNLRGQELQAESYAVARMNAIIHDMEAEDRARRHHDQPRIHRPLRRFARTLPVTGPPSNPSVRAGRETRAQGGAIFGGAGFPCLRIRERFDEWPIAATSRI